MNEGLSQSVESRESRMRREYAEAVQRYRTLKDSGHEAAEIYFRGRPAVNVEERAVGQLMLEQEALQSEAEAGAEQGRVFAERASRMIEQMKQAQITILSLYCDALHESDELAKLIAGENPWVVSLLEPANDAMYSVESKVA